MDDLIGIEDERTSISLPKRNIIKAKYGDIILKRKLKELEGLLKKVNEKTDEINNIIFSK